MASTVLAPRSTQLLCSSPHLVHAQNAAVRDLHICHFVHCDLVAKVVLQREHHLVGVAGQIKSLVWQLTVVVPDAITQESPRSRAKVATAGSLQEDTSSLEKVANADAHQHNAQRGQAVGAARAPEQQADDGGRLQRRCPDLMALCREATLLITHKCVLHA